MSSVTPINYSMPASPEVKIHNILKFGGIDNAQNPMASADGSASDMLNLYLDENMSLVTRPRLDFVEPLKYNIYGASCVYKTDFKHDGQSLTMYVYDEDGNAIYVVKNGESYEKYETQKTLGYGSLIKNTNDELFLLSVNGFYRYNPKDGDI